MIEGTTRRGFLSMATFGLLPFGLAQTVEPSLQERLDGGGEVRLPSGTHVIDAPLVIRTDVTLLGESWGTTLIVPAVSMPYLLRVSRQNVRVENVTLDAAKKAVHGLVLHDGGGSRFTHVRAKSYLVSGFQINEDYAEAGYDGNNNMAVFDQCLANAEGAGRHGWHVPTWGTDHNGITLDHCRSTKNFSHGALLKGHAWQVLGGNYFDNGGYGIQIGEGTTETRSQSAFLQMPWLESNVLGGVNFQRNSRATYIRNMTGGIQPPVWTDRNGSVAIPA